MPLTLLQVPRKDSAGWVRAMAEKKIGGKELAAELWAEHLGADFECFLCGAAIPTPPPPFTQLMPDKLPDHVIAAPPCPSAPRCRRCFARTVACGCGAR